jgi:hypothetical protein
LEAVTIRGANRLSGSIKTTLDGADLNADLLREAKAAEGLAGSAEYTGGACFETEPGSSPAGGTSGSPLAIARWGRPNRSNFDA